MWNTRFPLATSVLVLSALLAAQAQPQERRPTERPAEPDAPTATFRSGITLMTTVVIPRDRNGTFLADLTAQDFLVFEDDRPQHVVSVVPVLAGRAGNQLASPLRLQDGIILPPPPPLHAVGAEAGRLFVILIDDLNIEEGLTHRTRAVFEQLARNVIHDGDLFGVVSTGQSSIAIDVTADRSLLDGAATRIMGGGFNPNELIENFKPDRGGVPELMVRARMAFNTMRNIIRSLETVQHLRKVVIYLSSGYDFNPFLAERTRYHPGITPANPINSLARYLLDAEGSTILSDAGSNEELAKEIAELAAAANQANASFYTVDPRGLVAGPEAAHYRLNDTRSFNEWVFTTHNSLRSLAELTGGRAIVNRNDFDDAFRELDAATSDYYILGFTVGDSDSTVRRLRVQVRDRGDVQVQHRSHYILGGIAESQPPL